MSPRLPLAALAAVTALSSFAPAATAAKGDPTRAVKVMSRNIYLGGDIQRPIRGTAGCPDAQTCFVLFGQSNRALRDVVDATDFAARAELLADEIAGHDPHLVGLQEVALWRSGPLETAPDKVGVPNATTVDQDFLAILLDALAARGEQYEAAVVQQEADLEGPMFDGVPGVPATGWTPARTGDARLTMHDVILVRDGVTVHDEGGGNFQTNATANAAGRQITITRGFGWVDVTANKRSFRFVNTHLEAFSSLVALAQAQELEARAADTADGPVVMVGDYNSDPLDGSTKSSDPIPTPHWAPYRFLTGSAGGFADGWASLDTDNPGWTSGFSETVDDADASDVDHRIDFVFARPKSIPFSHGKIVGTDPDARTATGLWPSDHAGVVMKVRP